MQFVLRTELWAPAHHPLSLSEDAIMVFRFSLKPEQGSGVSLDRFRLLLSAEEQTRAERFRLAMHRNRFVVARATLRFLLGSLLGEAPQTLPLLVGHDGKPYLPGYPLHFNLSHSGDLAIVGVSRSRRLGIDVEEIRPLSDITHLAQNFTEQESRRFQPDAVPQLPPRSFFECWTRKEAVMKATGKGLSLSLRGFTVSFYPDPEVVLHSGSEDVSQWLLFDLAMGPSYSGALAVDGFLQDSRGPLAIECWDATQLRDRLIAC
jgi:4'-phosphopantetheinyl transferase